MSNTLWKAGLSVCLAAFGTASAADGTWTFGAVVDGQTGYYVGQKDSAELQPYLSYETETFEVSLHDGFAYHLMNDEELVQVSLLLTPRWEVDFGDDPLFAGLERDTAIEAGIGARFEAGWMFVEAEALTDVSGVHDGYEASAMIGVQQSYGDFSFEAGIGAVHRSDALNAHLFGVSAAEATATRSAYAPEESTTGMASLTAAYALNDSAAFVAEATYEDLGNMINSPLVETGETTSVTLGMVFQY